VGKTVKFAISIPEEDFKKLEALRREQRLTRSKAVLQAIIEESIAWEKASLTALAKEGWR